MNSVSLRYVISCLVSDVSVEQLLLFCWCFIHCCFDFASLASVLVLFSQWVNSSHHVAQSFSLQEIETRDALVSCHCVVFFLH